MVVEPIQKENNTQKQTTHTLEYMQKYVTIKYRIVNDKGIDACAAWIRNDTDEKTAAYTVELKMLACWRRPTVPLADAASSAAPAPGHRRHNHAS